MSYQCRAVRHSVQVYQSSTKFSVSEWDHFGADAPCPYRFSKDEIKAHYEEADSFNRTQDFWKKLRGILTDEGYTSIETYDQAVETVKNLREADLDVMEGADRDAFDKNTEWIVDLTN
jgi:hypothetical protein